MYKKQFGQVLFIAVTSTLIIILLWGIIMKSEWSSAKAGSSDTIYIPFVNIPPLQTIFGVEMNPITDSQGLAKMTSAESYWVRRNGFLWSAVEPIQGAGYDWSVLENLEADLLRARENDMEIIAIVRGVPDWARVPPYNYQCGPIDPDALPAFGDFMSALVERYSGSPYRIKYWEIWNEPDAAANQVPYGDIPYGCFGDTADSLFFGGEAYAEILKTVYPKVKQANPSAKVLIGGLLLACDPLIYPQNCISSRYLEGILVNGGKDFFDGVSFHAYDYFSKGETEFQTGIYGNLGWNNGGSGDTLVGDLKPSLVAKVEYINDLFSLYEVQGKFLINTETALLCGGFSDPPGGPGCEASADSDFEKVKAAYVLQSYTSAIAKGLLGNVWYTPLGWRNSGLLFNDLSHRPAYDAFVIARNTLKNATFIREIHEFESSEVFGYEFSVKNETVWVIWTLDGKSHTISLSSAPASVLDELGAPVALSGELLTVQGMKTYYVDWAP